MTNSAQMLKQVRRTISEVVNETSAGELRNRLEAADIILNTLELREDSSFLIRHIEHGRTLLQAGMRIADEVGDAKSRIIPAEPAAENSRADPLDEKTIDELNRALVSVVENLDEGRSPLEKNYLISLSDWESAFHSHNLEQTMRLEPEDDQSLTKLTLQNYLREKFPSWRDLEVVDFTRLNGGFSKKTILFSTWDSENGLQEMVIRAEQAVDLQCYEGCKVPREFHMIELMQKTGLPMAEPLWLESDPSKLGSRFIVSRRAPGKTYGGSLGSSEELTAEHLRSIIDTIVEMHDVLIDPADSLAQESHLREWLPHATISDALSHYVDVFLPRVMVLAKVSPSPQLVRGLKWLSSNVPVVSERPVVVHMDFSLNNLMIHENRVSAVLDWESSHLGDPAEDIIWTQQNLSSYISMEEFLSVYRARTGREITAYRLAYARVAKCAADSINCMSAMSAISSNAGANIKLAILAYKYLGIFGTQFNSLIETAEKLRFK